MKKYNKVIFLDIDGVLQAYDSKGRFNNIATIPQLQKELSDRYQIDYTKYDKYDIGAVYYDWDPHAVHLIKKIIKTTGAMIVVSSDWRTSGIERMRDFFRLHDMDQYVVGVTDDFTYEEYKRYLEKHQSDKHINSRTIEILEYLESHPYISNYVAIDDLDLSNGLEGHFVKTCALISEDDCEKCIAILRGDGGTATPVEAAATLTH